MYSLHSENRIWQVKNAGFKDKVVIARACRQDGGGMVAQQRPGFKAC